MAAIINALFGTYPEPEQQNTATNQTSVESNSASTTECLHTSAVADDVQVKSVISSETQANATMNNKLNIDSLLSQLSTTHAQVDQYSRARTAAINEQVQKSIADVLARTQRQQEELLADANRRHLIIDNEYKLQLQKAVEALDAVKAKTLAELERDLQAAQQAIMTDAKREIDVLNDQANAAKLTALVEAQEQASKDIALLADQVGVLGQLDTQNLLQSTTTTVITSQAQTAGSSEVAVTDNQMQVAVRSPTALVPVPTYPTETAGNVTAPTNPTETASNVTASDAVAESADITQTTTASATTSSSATVDTEVKPPQDNTTF